jgi:hypothetical protein
MGVAAFAFLENNVGRVSDSVTRQPFGNINTARMRLKNKRRVDVINFLP